MDGTTEFPHVATSPGEISQEVQDTHLTEQGEQKVPEQISAEETPSSSTDQQPAEQTNVCVLDLVAKISTEESDTTDLGGSSNTEPKVHSKVEEREVCDSSQDMTQDLSTNVETSEVSSGNSSQTLAQGKELEANSPPVNQEIKDEELKESSAECDEKIDGSNVQEQRELDDSTEDIAETTELTSEHSKLDTADDSNAEEGGGQVVEEKERSEDPESIDMETASSPDGKESQDDEMDKEAKHKMDEEEHKQATSDEKSNIRFPEKSDREEDQKLKGEVIRDIPKEVTGDESSIQLQIESSIKETQEESIEKPTGGNGEVDIVQQGTVEGELRKTVESTESANVVERGETNQEADNTDVDKTDSDQVPCKDEAIVPDEARAIPHSIDISSKVNSTTDDGSKGDVEEAEELMDTQILESDEGNTQESSVQDTEKADGDKAQATKEEKLQNFLPLPVKIFDECSMESFTSAKSSEFDYMDSPRGSPLPVKRVRELIDQSPRSSPVPSKRSRAGSYDTESAAQSDDDLGHFPAENVFEYQWPQDHSGDWYFVQEQISEFLGVKSFKRKYPELERRVMDIKEKEFLRERGVVTEEQVTLGLTALRGDEVYDLMMKDYPNRYAEYARVLQEKQRQNISDQHKGYEAPTVDASKIKEYIKKAVKQAADFNALLMRERREERQYYFDLQTMQIHMPKARMKVLTKEATEVGPYPVAVIPGQYQYFCRDFASSELHYLPLSTATYGPMAIRKKTDYGPDVAEQEGEDDVDSLPELNQLEDPVTTASSSARNTETTTTSLPETATIQQSSSITAPPTITVAPPTSTAPPLPPPTVGPGPIPSGPGPNDDMDFVRLPGPEALQMSMESVVPANHPYQPKDLPNAICGICLKNRHSNPKGVPEELVHCSQCDNSGHPSCLDMNIELVMTIKTYPWQCMECKTCTHCGDPTHEDKMMFCDQCDRGYHTFCVGLTDIPTGLWACQSCSANGTLPVNGAPPTNGLPTAPPTEAAPQPPQPPAGAAVPAPAIPAPAALPAPPPQPQPQPQPPVAEPTPTKRQRGSRK